MTSPETLSLPRMRSYNISKSKFYFIFDKLIGYNLLPLNVQYFSLATDRPRPDGSVQIFVMYLGESKPANTQKNRNSHFRSLKKGHFCSHSEKVVKLVMKSLSP